MLRSPIEPAAQSGRARQRPQFSILGLVARNLLTLGMFGSCANRIPDHDAAERDVDMFISPKDGRISRIFAIGAAQPGPIRGSG